MTAETLDAATRLALERTQAAYERTLMAWVRTATSLIGFGFSLYKFFEFDAKGTRQSALLVGPRDFALLMVAAGILSLLLGEWDYVRRMKPLRALYPDLDRSRAVIIVAAIAVLGVAAILGILF
jgi:putative membrane protein